MELPAAQKIDPKRGERLVNKDGYVWIRGEGLEHRRVMEEMLGRALVRGENVHHLNGQRADNRPENLELWIVGQPAGQRVEDAVAWAHEIIERYELVK